MKKPASLRAHLLARLPSLQNDPKRLIIYVDNGRVAVTGKAPITLSSAHDLRSAQAIPLRSFMYRANYCIYVLNYTGSPSDIIAATVEWLQNHQSDLMDNANFQDNGVSFDVEYINTQAINMEIILNGVTENIAVSDGPNKKQGARTNDINNVYTIEPLEEPQRDDLLHLMQ